MSKIKDLIPKYIQLVTSESVNSELYKWTAIQHFQENWNGDCSDEDFHEMFKKAFAKRENLIFQNSFGFLNSLAKYMPLEAKQLLNYLFQEDIPLEERLPQYQEKANELLPELKEKSGKNKLNHQQDERTLSFLLTLYNPEKYFLYKDNVYQWLCELNEIKGKEAGQKYFHFCELAKEELSLLKENEEIQQLTKSFIPKDFKFDSTNLIFQDILFRTMPRTEQLRKSFFKELVNEVKNYLELNGHPLSEHIWTKEMDRYRWISFWKNVDIDPYFLHYEIILDKDELKVELHPEGSQDFKKEFEPFMSQINLNLHKKTSWKHGAKENQNGKFSKIVSRTKCCTYSNELEPTTIQIEAVANRLIEYYENYQTKIENYLEKIQFPFVPELEPQKMKTPLNQILYGPPGTGKTYSTIDKVVEICDADYQEGNHLHNKSIYDRLVKEGRVVFTTFHQSMAYEDFIEGIKPVRPRDEDVFLKYEVETGLFQQIANSAKALKNIRIEAVDWDKTAFYKMSIGGKGRPDIHNWCIENSVVGLSWGGDEDLTQLVTYAKSNNWILYRDKFKELYPKTAEDNRYNIQASFILNKMRIGDIVVISKGNQVIDAIGKITGDYYFDDQTPTDMVHFRKVEWIATELDASPDKFIDKQISQQSIYEFYDKDVKKDTFKSLTKASTEETKPYVLIIDEINRGNVSAIFGELITLIEDDKRMGAPNELKITLPYSKEKFGVPSNLYILGTMNTADRSVEALDTALRRRFSFTEMLPKPELLSPSAMLTRLMWRYENVGWEDAEYLDKENNLRSFLGQTDDVQWKERIDIWDTKMKGKDSAFLDHFKHFDFNGYNIEKLLKTINERIEVLVDRDHTIGHAFFMNVNSIEDLRSTFAKNIIPLLQEYFYGNYEKMEMVIGSSFFEDLSKKTVEFAVKNYSYDDLPKRYKLKAIDEKFDIEHAIDDLLNKKKTITSDSEE